MNSSAFEQSTLNFFWKRDILPYKIDRIYSTTLSTDVFSAIARDSLESSSNKANYLLGPQQKHKIWTKNNGWEGLLFLKHPVKIETMKTRLKRLFCCRNYIILIQLIFCYVSLIILLSICSYHSFHSQIQWSRYHERIVLRQQYANEILHD